MPTPEEQFRDVNVNTQRVIEHPATAPQRISIIVAANLTGVGVRIARDPSSGDPFGQALDQLPGICRNAIADIAMSNAPKDAGRQPLFS